MIIQTFFNKNFQNLINFVQKLKNRLILQQKIVLNVLNMKKNSFKKKTDFTRYIYNIQKKLLRKWRILLN